MEDWKSMVRDLLGRHREEILLNCRATLETFPDLTKQDEEKEYFQKLHNSICDQWNEFLVNSKKSVPFKGNLEDFPQNDPSFLGEYWKIQMEVDKIYGDRFNNMVKAVWKNKTKVQ
ncbi:hypothetical protein [Arenibacter sp. S6351L]|jgi:hypothetical protein|uniref:hypothetical protein n=1 Tax=Arenibacter sp. S6351L TaxID=2926407 RepID=UPI001FF195C3|nr:hypothetical protein [Arenibacter sp. S6351L]MCK0133366.1 hypothetical protein [Arenibacter sp. S6351L]